MAATTLRSGDPQTIQYTPSAGDLASGDVVLIGNTTGLANGIAVGDIDNNVQGTLAVGGGIYEAINLNNAADGATVYWDASTEKLTTTSTNMSLFGYVVENGGGGANSNCLALHHPFV